MNYMGVSLMSMGGDESLVGIASTTTALAEIPFMAFSGWFIRRFGLTRLMTFAMLLMAVRYSLLALMPSPGWAIYINLMNGPAFALFATCAVAYAQKLAPPSLIVTSQGLLNSTASLAGVVSALLTGVLFDQIGPQGIFWGMAICCLAAFILFVGGALCFRSLRSTQEAV
jgi:MFS family permease